MPGVERSEGNQRLDDKQPEDARKAGNCRSERSLDFRWGGTTEPAKTTVFDQQIAQGGAAYNTFKKRKGGSA
jgi:hypothetical protein